MKNIKEQDQGTEGKCNWALYVHRLTNVLWRLFQKRICVS